MWILFSFKAGSKVNREIDLMTIKLEQSADRLRRYVNEKRNLEFFETDDYDEELIEKTFPITTEKQFQSIDNELEKKGALYKETVRTMKNYYISPLLYMLLIENDLYVPEKVSKRHWKREK